MGWIKTKSDKVIFGPIALMQIGLGHFFLYQIQVNVNYITPNLLFS